MKLRNFGLSAALVAIASVASIAAPAKAANLETSDRSAINLAQTPVGLRDGDVCRIVTESSTLYAEPSSTSNQIANMLENEMVHYEETITADDGTVWFEIEDSVGNMGYMPAYMSGTRLANLSYCSATPATFPAAW